jgi:hypothetical protein
VESLGYNAIRADKISEQGIITNQVVRYIIECPLVIADLTRNNPNVLYELAIRHAVRKPFVQIIKRGEKIPFDISGTRTVEFDMDIISASDAMKQIRDQVIALETNPNIDTPVSVSLDLKALTESGNPQQRSFAEIVQYISELKAEIITVREELRNNTYQLPRSYLDYLLKQSYPGSLVDPEVTSEMQDTVNDLSARIIQNKAIGNVEMRFIVRKLQFLIKQLKMPLY